MFAFICCFFPAVVGVWIFEVLSKKRLTVRQCIYRYCGYTLAANFVYTAVKMFVLKTATSPILVDAEMIPRVAFHYLIVVIPAVLLFVFGELLFGKKIQIVVEDIDADETTKRKD